MTGTDPLTLRPLRCVTFARRPAHSVMILRGVHLRRLGRTHRRCGPPQMATLGVANNPASVIARSRKRWRSCICVRHEELHVPKNLFPYRPCEGLGPVAIRITVAAFRRIRFLQAVLVLPLSPRFIIHFIRCVAPPSRRGNPECLAYATRSRTPCPLSASTTTVSPSWSRPSMMRAESGSSTWSINVRLSERTP